MINTDKYEGHTSDWKWIDISEQDDFYLHSEHGDIINHDTPDGKLAQDAPLLLAEVKRLRELLVKGSEDYTTSYTDLRKIIEDVHWALTGDDVHYSQSDDARITYALGILSEVIG